jgi:hypothetical protein
MCSIQNTSNIGKVYVMMQRGSLKGKLFLFGRIHIARTQFKINTMLNTKD